jgi:hypothetical protein
MQLRVVAATLMFVLLLVGRASAVDDDACGPGFSPAFVLLQGVLGNVMGVPTTCQQDASNGDLVQETSTGVAIYRASTRATVFVSGEQRWALTDNGFVEWTGSWHGGLDPPGAVPARDDPVGQSSPPSSDDVASILVPNLVRASTDDPEVLVMESDGGLYLVRTDEGCPDAWQEVGRPVYVRSQGSLGTPGAVLVLLREHESCPILAVELAPGP